MKHIVKQSINTSLIAQGITLFVNFFGLAKDVGPTHLVLKEILGLETFVQIVELLFYIWYRNTHSLNGQDITRFRYYDWVLTTPVMLFSTMCFYVYLKTIESDQVTKENTNKKPVSIWSIFKEHKSRILQILFLNFLMLLVGYLQEIHIVSLTTSTLLGFGALFGSFYGIYDTFVKDVSDKRLFLFTFFVWSLYGIAAMFSVDLKNISYNILDIFAKNFYGLYLSYYISTL
jgi:hypothetical protein